MVRSWVYFEGGAKIFPYGPEVGCEIDESRMMPRSWSKAPGRFNGHYLWEKWVQETRKGVHFQLVEFDL